MPHYFLHLRDGSQPSKTPKVKCSMISLPLSTKLSKVRETLWPTVSGLDNRYTFTAKLWSATQKPSAPRSPSEQLLV